MATFLDESGDVGTGLRSARFFRLAAVSFEDESHIEQYQAAVRELRADVLKVTSRFEFHFTELSDGHRTAFFDAVADVPFHFAACSFEKAEFDASQLTKGRIRLETVKGLVSQLREYYEVAEGCKVGSAGLNERIIYDECDDPMYKTVLKRAFQALCSTRGIDQKLIRSVKPGKSRVDDRIQLADMVCGAVGRHINGESAFYNRIKKKSWGLVVLNRKGSEAAG